MRVHIFVVLNGLWLCCSQAHSGQFAWDYNSWKKNAMGCVQLPSPKEVRKRYEEVRDYIAEQKLIHAPIETMSQETIDDVVSKTISAAREAKIGITWLECFSKKPAYIQFHNEVMESFIQESEDYAIDRSQLLRALHEAKPLFKPFNVPDDILALWLDAVYNDQAFMKQLREINPRVDFEVLRPLMQQAIDRGLRPNTVEEAVQAAKAEKKIQRQAEIAQKKAERKKQIYMLFENMKKAGLSLDAMPSDWIPEWKTSIFVEVLIPYWDSMGMNLEDHVFIEAVNERLRLFKAWKDINPPFSLETREKIWKEIQIAAIEKYDQYLEKEILDNIDPKTFDDAPKLVETLERALKEKKSYPARRLLAQAHAFELLDKTGKPGDFPFKELWRFHIDGKRQEEGPYAFDDEQKYILNSLTGLQMVLNPKSSFSPEFYISLQATMKKGGVLGIGNFDQGFYLKGLDQDEVGLRDIQKRGTLKKNSPFSFESGLLMARGAPVDERLKELRELFAKHDTYVQKNVDAAKRLMAHLWLARELELRHFFSDGNGRCSNMLLVGMIAKDPSLPMLMFEDPNVLDANGPEKLAYRALQAMDNFQKHGMAKTYTLSKHTLKLKDLHFEDSRLEKLREDLEKLTEGKEWDVFHKAM